MLPSLLQEIEAYTRAVFQGHHACRIDRCPRCDLRPGHFTRHALRPRVFLAVVDGWVRRLASFVTRYRCPICGATFTDYPAFARPHQRYVTATILDRAGHYLHEDDATYRDAAATEGGRLTFYGAPAQMTTAAADPAIDDRALAPSTVWRWLAGLAALGRCVDAAKRLLREASSRAFDRAWAVAPRKARTPERRHLLERAAELVHVEALFRAVFPGASIFTGLATTRDGG